MDGNQLGDVRERRGQGATLPEQAAVPATSTQEKGPHLGQMRPRADACHCYQSPSLLGGIGVDHGGEEVDADVDLHRDR